MNHRDGFVPERSADESEIEQKIIEAGATAPRITPNRCDEKIRSRAFFTALQGARMAGIDYLDQLGQIAQPEPLDPALGVLTICVLVLENGYIVTGESACASPENFNLQIGQDIAFRNARDKIWGLEGYLLKQRLYETELSQKGSTKYRDAETGEYVSEEYALLNPATTIKEST